MGSVIPSARVLCSFSIKSTAYKNTSLSEASVWTFGVAVCRNCGTEGEGSAGCRIQRDLEGACWQLVGVQLGLGLGSKKCVVCCQPKKIDSNIINHDGNGQPFQKRHVLRQANTWMHTVHRNVRMVMADPFRRARAQA